MQSRISIVTISYNQAAFLQEAISSVHCSDPARLQYVVVDPGSHDNSREIIERNRGRFDRVLFELDEGPADGLNKGFASCDGDIFGYLNSDDRFCPGALDFVLDYFDANPGVDVLFGAIRMIDREGRPGLRNRTPDVLDLRRFAYRVWFIWQQATFFRREAFRRAGGFNVENRIHWDSELVVDMVLKGARVGYVKKLLGDFRLHSESITGSRRWVELDRREAARVREKVLAAGYAPYSPLEARLAKWRFKFDVQRHWSYVFGVERL